MDAIQWEYCSLTVEESEGTAPNTSYHCQVCYFVSAYEKPIEHHFITLGSPSLFFH